MPNQKIRKESQVVIDWLRQLGMDFHTGFIVLNPEHEELPIIYANDAFYEMSGYTEAEVIGNNGRFMHGLKTDKSVGEKIRNCMKTGKAGIYEILNYRKNGTTFWNEITVQPIVTDGANSAFTLMLQREITERKQTEALIKFQQENYNDIGKGYMLSFLLQRACHVAESFFKDGTRCTVVFIGDDGNYIIGAGASMPKEFNEWLENTSYDKDAGTCGAAFNRNETVIVEDMRTDPLWESSREVVESFNLASSCSVPILDTEGQPIGAFGIYFSTPTTPSEQEVEFLEKMAPIVSLTVSYSKQQEEILRLAYTDQETKLPNRNYFMNELKELMMGQKEGFVAFVTADEYMNIVDQYGHRAGDALICEMGRRFIRVSFSSDYLVARFSDSTVAIFCSVSLDKIPECLEVLTHSTMEPVQIQDIELFLTLKMGVAIITANQCDGDEAIRYADSALSKAKLRAGESICYFENEHDEYMMKNLRIANELTAALRRGEINVYLQPKVELRTGRITSFEALARWHSPELGNIPPDVFIPAAEKNGKIRLLEQRIITQVLSWLKKRQDEGIELFQIAVNISADHFFHHSFIPYLVDESAKFGIGHKWVQLEITERIGLVDIETAYKVFKQLKNYGFTSSVDDFGTGYSSLSYLQKLPVNEIKIDRSFISKMHEPDTLAIVRTIIQLAENLEMLAVAEGIETEEQRRILVALGCRIGQGYLFHRPMPLNEASLL